MGMKSSLRKFLGFPKKSIYLLDDGRPKTIIATGKTQMGGMSSPERSESLLKKFWDYYENENTVFAAIQTIAWTTIMVGYNLTSNDLKAKELIQKYLDYLDIDLLLLDNVIYALVYGDAFIEIVKNSNNKITSLKTVDPITMVINTDKFGIITGYQQKIQGILQKTILKPEDIIHIKFFTRSKSPYGISLIQPSKGTLDRKIATDEAIANAIIRHGCYDDKTEILTKNGWKLFKDLAKNIDEVATYNPDKSCLEYKIPKEYVEYDWDGKLDKYETDYIDLLTTPDHEHYWKFKHRFDGKEYWTDYKKTKNRETSCFKFKTYTENFIGELSELPKEFSGWSYDQYIKLLGWYLSEGSLHHDKEIIIHQNENSKHYLELDEFMHTLPLKCKDYHRFRENATGYSHEFRLYSSELCKYFKQFGKHDKKFIPVEVKNYPRKHLKLLLDTLLMGDGHKVSDTEYYYYTTSKQLADDVQEISIKLGYSTTIKFKESTNEKWKDTYDVRIRKIQGMEPIFYNHLIEEEYYKGKVYCVYVDNHVFFVRRNGKVILSGNTSKYLVKVGTEEEFPPPEIFTDIKNELEDITYINEIIVPGLVDVKAIDEKGVAGVEEYSGTFLQQLITGLLCPPEALGMGKGSTEATASVRQMLYERMIRTFQIRIANLLRLEVLNKILAQNGFEPNLVKIKFNSVTDADEAVKAKWLGDLLRGYDPRRGEEKPFTIDEVRAMFGYGPKEIGHDKEVPTPQEEPNVENEENVDEEKYPQPHSSSKLQRKSSNKKHRRKNI